MLVVETIAKIRRLHFTEGKGIKTICRDLKLSKKVVRKVIRTGMIEFSYTRTVQPRPKLGAWLDICRSNPTPPICSSSWSAAATNAAP